MNIIFSTLTTRYLADKLGDDKSPDDLKSLDRIPRSLFKMVGDVVAQLTSKIPSASNSISATDAVGSRNLFRINSSGETERVFFKSTFLKFLLALENDNIATSIDPAEQNDKAFFFNSTVRKAVEAWKVDLKRRKMGAASFEADSVTEDGVCMVCCPVFFPGVATLVLYMSDSYIKFSFILIFFQCRSGLLFKKMTTKTPTRCLFSPLKISRSRLP